MPVIIPDAYRIIVHGHSTGSLLQWEITPGVFDDDTHTTARMEDIRDAVVAWVESDLIDVLDDTNVCDEVRVEDLAASALPTVVAGVSETGTVGGNPAGGQVAAITTLRTNLSGRSHRGRIYWPGVSSTFINAVDGTTLDPDAITAYDAAANALVAAVDAVAAATTLAVVSRTLTTAFPILSVSTRQYLGTQRRRVHTP